jgi:hypothetical protein
MWEALTDIRLISCSRVSISELWFLLSSRNVPDLPRALGDSEYFCICAWYRSRLEANPEDVPAPDNSELDLHGQDLTAPLSASPSTCQAAADESSSVPSDRQIDSVDVRQSPEISYITRDSMDDAHAPRRSLEELSRSLVRGVTLRPTRTHVASAGVLRQATPGRVSFVRLTPETGSPDSVPGEELESIQQREIPLSDTPGIISSKYGPLGKHCVQYSAAGC